METVKKGIDYMAEGDLEANIKCVFVRKRGKGVILFCDMPRKTDMEWMSKAELEIAPWGSMQRGMPKVMLLFKQVGID
jgi:hypothetical protein